MIRDLIAQNCNPVNHRLYSDILETLYKLDISEYEKDLMDMESKANNMTIVIDGSVIEQLLRKSLFNGLTKVGVTLHDFLVDTISLDKLHAICKVFTEFDVIDIEVAHDTRNMMDDDTSTDDMLLTHHISSVLNITLLTLFEDVDTSIIDKLGEICDATIDKFTLFGEMDTDMVIEERYRVLQKKTIDELTRMSSTRSLEILKLFTNEIPLDTKFKEILGVIDIPKFNDMILDDVILNLIAMLLLGSDSRYKRRTYLEEYLDTGLNDLSFGIRELYNKFDVINDIITKFMSNNDRYGVLFDDEHKGISEV